MYYIIMFVKRTGQWIEMPNEVGLEMLDALERVGMYSRRNRDCHFAIVDEFIGDIVYVTE